MYQIDFKNVKTNVFTRIFDLLFKNANDVRIQY